MRKLKGKDNSPPQQSKSQFTGCQKVLLYDESGSEGVVTLLLKANPSEIQSHKKRIL